jgi:CRISPR/Cas system-associated exonuclease Cas4 (RecB family)
MTAGKNANRFRLSKSKVAAFEHCPRRLWLQLHRRDAAVFDPETLKRFAIGHRVGERARDAFRDGILVDEDFQAALVQTRELLLLSQPVPIFEATFQFKDVLIRADILEPDGAGAWRAIEVKASSRVRSYQLADLATQVWVMLGCGVPIASAYIRHVRGPLKWDCFDADAVQFQDEDVTRQLLPRLKSRAHVVDAARKAIRGDEIKREMGSHCERPFACEFAGHCRRCIELPLLSSLPLQR